MISGTSSALDYALKNSLDAIHLLFPSVYALEDKWQLDNCWWCTCHCSSWMPVYENDYMQTLEIPWNVSSFLKEASVKWNY